MLSAHKPDATALSMTQARGRREGRRLCCTLSLLFMVVLLASDAAAKTDTFNFKLLLISAPSFKQDLLPTNSGNRDVLYPWGQSIAQGAATALSRSQQAAPFCTYANGLNIAVPRPNRGSCRLAGSTAAFGAAYCSAINDSRTRSLRMVLLSVTATTPVPVPRRQHLF